MEGILIGLELAGYGLGGVFLSLILLYIAILVMRRFFKIKGEDTTEER